MMDCSLAHQSSIWLCADDPTQQHGEVEFYHSYWLTGICGSQFRLKMKNLSMLRWPFCIAGFIVVSFLLFLLIGSQCILKVRNFTTSSWPLSAALWSGVVYLHIGSQRFFTVRNFTTFMLPLMAAQWRGVYLYSFKHDGLQPCSSITFRSSK